MFAICFFLFYFKVCITVIKILFNYRREQTQDECVVRANGRDTTRDEHDYHYSTDAICSGLKRLSWLDEPTGIKAKTTYSGSR